MGTLKIVDRRITKILKTIDHIINSNFIVSARSLASFTGHIFSTGPVVGNIGRIMARHCVMSTLCGQGVNPCVILNLILNHSCACVAQRADAILRAPG